MIQSSNMESRRVAENLAGVVMGIIAWAVGYHVVFVASLSLYHGMFNATPTPSLRALIDAVCSVLVWPLLAALIYHLSRKYARTFAIAFFLTSLLVALFFCALAIWVQPAGVLAPIFSLDVLLALIFGPTLFKKAAVQ
jgi:hypothetical protein